MIAITPWILVLAATCQDPKPAEQAELSQTATTQTPVAQAPVTQTPTPVPPATGGTGDTTPAAQGTGDTTSAAQGAGNTTPAAPAPSNTEANKSDASAPNEQQPETDKAVPDKTDAQKSDADKANPGTPDETSAKPQGWVGLDGVALIINQDITTQGDIEREYYIKYRDKPVKDGDEVSRRQNDILNERVKRVLAMQAGEDLGASEELVKLQINDWFENVVKRYGGVVKMTQVLEARHQTPQDLRQDRREEIYVRLWEGLITGEGAGVGKRPIHDRFIRPGELLFHYRQVIQDPGNYPALGGTLETLTLQRILLDPKENGGLEKTIEFAKGLRQRILDGDDMGDLVQKYGKEKDSMMRDIPLADLKRQFPSMGVFAEKAQVDDISEPMRLQSKNATLVQILRLVERKPGVKPELTSQEVQKTITKSLQKTLDDHRKQLGYGVLFDASYVWPEQHSKQQ